MVASSSNAMEPGWEKNLPLLGTLGSRPVELNKSEGEVNVLWVSVGDWTVFPHNLFDEALTLNMTIFGDKAFEEVVKVKQSHRNESLTQ